MSSNLNIPFTTSGNYTFDSDDIEVTGGVAKLKLQQNDLDFTQAFTNDTGFTYDNTKAEFTGGKVQQKAVAIVENYSQAFSADTGFTYDNTKAEFASGLARTKNQRPTNATFGATFTSSINGSWGNGTLTGAAYGGASVSGGKLDLAHNDIRHVTYPFASNFTNKQKGTIKLKYTPNYTGIPGAFVYYSIFTLYQSAGNQENSIALWHFPAGNMKLLVYDPITGFVVNADFGVWDQTQGQEYELECSWDLTNGANRLFIDGVQKGSTNTQTGQIANLSYIVIGGSYSNVYNCNFSIDDVIFYSEVQHTSNYTPAYTVTEYDYLESVVTCPSMAYLYNIVSLGSPTITEVNAPKYIVNGYAYFGGSWQASSNTYATAMTYADWQTNIATFPGAQLSSGVIVKVIFQDSNTLSSIDSIAFDINESHYEASNVTLPEMEHTYVGTIKLGNSLTTTEANAPRYTLQVGRSGNYLYWDSLAWATSNGTYAQANTAATFNTNFPTLDIAGENYGQFKIHFDTSNSQAYVDNLVTNVNVDIGYVITNPMLTVNSTFKASELLSFVETSTKPTDTEVKYIINVGGQDKWYNSGIVNSNGTYSQANTASEIEANIEDFLSDRSTIQIKIFFHTADDQETPLLDNILISYDSAKEDPEFTALNAPTQLEGYLFNAGLPRSGQEIKIRPYLTGFAIDEAIFPYIWQVLATTNAQGWFEADIYVQSTGKYWEIKVGSERYKVQLADIETNYLEDCIIEFLGVEE